MYRHHCALLIDTAAAHRNFAPHMACVNCTVIYSVVAISIIIDNAYIYSNALVAPQSSNKYAMGCFVAKPMVFMIYWHTQNAYRSANNLNLNTLSVRIRLCCTV